MAEMSSCRKVPLSKLNAHLELKLTYTNSSGEKKKLFDLQDNTNSQYFARIELTAQNNVLKLGLEMLGIDFPTGVNRVSTCVQQMRAVVGADEGSNLKEGYRDLFAGFTNQERQCMLEALLGLDTLDINPDTLSRKRSASTMVGNGDINSGVFVQSKAGPSSQYELGSKARSQPPTLHDILQDDMLLMGRPTKYHCNSMGMEEDLRGIIPEEESMCGYMVGVDWDSILA
ncbi:hypothetical protein EDC01DRAFT_634325 [Geopyxis carbonaria]|nr:hypothetical protein EDC01DRAFT_634325 [Geopyxis carbonaria]